VGSLWRKLLAQIEMVAPRMLMAAIEGEAGSGKYTLARYLQSRSALATAAFQRHDAREWLTAGSRPAMPTGVLYLDRVDLLEAPEQNLFLAILKNLQDRANGPVPRTILIASSQSSLRQIAGQGLFLPDLAFRLTAIRFAVPPLRHRREDIAPLTQYLLDLLCLRYKQRPVMLGQGVLARLLQHNWPGNVRELACVLESALLEATNGVISPADLTLPDPGSPGFDVPAKPAARPADLSLDAAIREHVQYVLNLNHGNKLRTARLLRISRSTLYRILANESPFGQLR
jgi:DNA-binding NtrC family response regulator